MRAARGMAMRTLLIDNYDSYTFNLFHLLGEVNGEEPIVVRNDDLPWDDLAALRPDNIVISPGPGRPEHPRDAGVSLEVLRRAEVPVLGVCLGHQDLAYVCGGLASVMGWATPVTTYKLTLAAFLHDITMEDQELARLQTRAEEALARSTLISGKSSVFWLRPGCTFTVEGHP